MDEVTDVDIGKIISRHSVKVEISLKVRNRKRTPQL